MEAQSHESRDFSERRGNMTDAHGTVVSRALFIPGIDESTGSQGKLITAVGVAYLQNLASHAFALSDNQFEALRCVFNHGKKRDRAVLYTHFDGEAPAHLSVVDLERAHFRLSLGNGDMAWTIVAH